MTESQAHAGIEKKMADIARKEAWIAKCRAAVAKKEAMLPPGLQYSAARDRWGEVEIPEKKIFAGQGGDSQRIFYLLDDIETQMNSILKAEKDIEAMGRQIAGFQAAMGKAAAAADYFDSLPGAVRTLAAELAANWIENGLRERESAKAELAARSRDMRHKEYISLRETAMQTDSQIVARQERAARAWATDLADRVRQAVGDILEWRDLRRSGHALNGTVIGTKGACRIETVAAGGYNIQCLHLRALVHRIA